MKNRSNIFIAFASVFPYIYFILFYLLEISSDGKIFHGETTAGLFYLFGIYILTPALFIIASAIIGYDIISRKLNINKKIMSIFLFCMLTIIFLILFSYFNKNYYL